MAKAKPTAATAPTTAEDMEVGTRQGSGESGKAILTHVLGLLTLFVGPLVLYFVFRGKTSPWLRAHLAGSTNDGLLTFLLFVVLVVALALLSQVGIAVTILALLLFVLLLMHVAASVLALLQSARGKPFHIPLCPQWLR